MNRRLITPQRVLAAVMLLLLLCGLAPTPIAAGAAYVPRQAVSGVVFLAALPFKLIANALRPGTSLPLDPADARPMQEKLLALRQDNIALKNYNEKLLGELKRLYENQKLQKFFPPSITPIPADVAAWSPDPGHPTLTLYCGSMQGVEAGMAVCDDSWAFLVGRVVDVGPRTATVELITAPRANLSVAIYSPTGRADRTARTELVVKIGKGSPDFTNTIKKDSPVAVGDLARLADTRWPAAALGMVVGQVVAVEPLREDPLFSVVHIQPVKPFSSLARVIVLAPTGPPAPPAPPQR